MQDSSFYDFIADIEHTPYLRKGEGKDARVFILPIAALDEYVVRVAKHRKVSLKNSTALTPVDCHYPYIHVGQPLLYSNDIQIILKQPGTSITHAVGRRFQQLLRKGRHTSEAQTESAIDMSKQLASLPDSAYEWLLYDMNRITENGHSIDVIGENVMVSHSDLGWVDVNMTPAADPSRNFVRNVFNCFVSPDLPRKSPELEHIKDKLLAAGKKVDAPISHKDGVKRAEKVGFRQVSSIKGLKKILLKETPEEIAALLHDVRQHVGLR